MEPILIPIFDIKGAFGVSEGLSFGPLLKRTLHLRLSCGLLMGFPQSEGRTEPGRLVVLDFSENLKRGTCVVNSIINIRPRK